MDNKRSDSSAKSTDTLPQQAVDQPPAGMDAADRDKSPTAVASSEASKPINPRSDMPPGTSLAQIFRFHMGIENDHNLVPQSLARKSAIDPIATGKYQGRRAVNLGIYNRCIREEMYNSRQFTIWTWIINGALGLQIIFGALLTALGAAQGPSDVVAIFGALNTVIAGFLTYIKGTGLPTRMKYFHNQWLKLRAYIEQRERDFSMDDIGLHRFGYVELTEEVDIIEKMYHNIRKDIERHTPDSYAGGGGSDGSDEAPGEGAPEATLGKKGLNALKTKLSGAGAAATSAGASHVKGLVDDLESRLTSHISTLTGTTQGTTAQGKTSNGKGPEVTVSETKGADTSGDQDVSDIAISRMEETRSRALKGQEEAEAKVKELEAKLATLQGASTSSST